MKSYEINYGDNKTCAIHIPTDLSEYTLGQLIDKSKLEEELVDFENRLLELDMYKEFGENNGKEYTQEDYDRDSSHTYELYYENMVKQISMFIPESQHSLLWEIPYTELPIILDKIDMSGDAENISEPEILFTCSEACNYDVESNIKEFEKLSWVTDFKEKYRLKQLIKKLKKGQIILIPAKNALFKTRVVTDNIQELLPKIPEDIKKTLDEEGVDLFQMYDKLRESSYTSLKEFKVINKQTKAISKYVKEYESGFYQSALKLISHASIPLGLEYDFEAAEARSEGYRTLDLYTAKKLLNFFLLLKEVSTKNMGSFFNLLKKPQPQS